MTQQTTAQALLARGSWRFRHSLWLLAPILGVGLLSFVGFVYLGVRTRARPFVVAAVIGCLGSTLAWVASSWKEPATGELTDAGAAVGIGTWVALVAYGFVINRGYLRWRADRATATPWYAEQPTPAPQPAPAGFAPAAPVAPTGQASDLRGRLDAIVAQVHQRGELPADVVGAVDRLSGRLHALLLRAEQLASRPDHLRLVERIITEYVPTSLTAYAALPREYALSARTTGGRTYHEELLHQLGLLEGEVADIGSAIYAGDAARLETQGRYLEERFRRSELDLP